MANRSGGRTFTGASNLTEGGEFKENIFPFIQATPAPALPVLEPTNSGWTIRIHPAASEMEFQCRLNGSGE